MNNTLISTIRFGVIAGVALLAFAGEVFAAPVLTPATATTFSATSVILSARVSNPVWKNTPVWFEVGEVGTPMIVVGLTTVYNQGPLETRITDLKPGARYSFRAVAMDVDTNTTVYSPTAFFSIRDGSAVSTPSANANTGAQATQSASANTADAVVATDAKKVATTPAVNKNLEDKKTETATTAVKSTNRNSASVIGAGEGVLPSTLIGWIALIISLLFAVLLIHMIIESNEKRRKEREEEEEARREKETQDKEN